MRNISLRPRLQRTCFTICARGHLAHPQWKDVTVAHCADFTAMYPGGTGSPLRRRLEHPNEIFLTLSFPTSFWEVLRIYFFNVNPCSHPHYFPCHLFNSIVTVIKTGLSRLHGDSFLPWKKDEMVQGTDEDSVARNGLFPTKKGLFET